MIGLALTLDYEIYGNGTGNIQDHIINPTEDFLTICEKYQGKGTLFVDVAELIKMKEYNCFAEEIAGVEKQLKDAHERGHDVQLHLHPWWFNAKFNGSTWEMDYNLTTLNYLNPEIALEYISRCKKYLTELLACCKRRYSCVAYRAGYWSMMPTKNIFKALTEAGIETDSSVYKWGKVSKQNIFYDYSKAHSNCHPWYFSSEDINKISPERQTSPSCLEIPIYTENNFILKFLSLKRISILKKSKSALVLDRLPPKTSWRNKVARLIHLDTMSIYRPKKFDFCKCTFNEMKRMIYRIIKASPGNLYLPVVAIGHSKDFIYRGDLIKFLYYLKSHHDKTVEVVPLTSAEKYKKTDV